MDEGGLSFGDIAPYLQHPLVLVGFGVFVVFGFYRVRVGAQILPQVSRAASGRIVAMLVRYGFIVALVLMLLGFGLAFFREWRGEEARLAREAAVTDAIAAVEAQYTERVAALEGERTQDRQTIASLNAAVRALAAQAEAPDAPPGIDAALARLGEGDRSAAQKIFRGIAERRAQAGAAAHREAAEAYRHLGALAYLGSTEDALQAYRRAAELDPSDTWTWIFIGRLELRAGRLAWAESAFLQAQERATTAGDDRDLSVSLNALGDVRRAQGDLAGALESYGAGLAIAERLAAQDPAHAGWQRDLIVSHWKLAQTHLGRAGSREMARQDFEEALRVALQLKDGGRLAPSDDWMIPALEEELAALGAGR